MISGFKNKLLVLLVTAALLFAGLAVLSHHSMAMSTNDGHADCNVTCKIACFGQTIGSLVAIPNHLDGNLFVLPLVTLLLISLVIVSFSTFRTTAFQHSLGPPLYKRFETYRY